VGKGREREGRVTMRGGEGGESGGSGGGSGGVWAVGCGMWYVDGREDGRWVGCGKAGKAVNVDFCMLWVMGVSMGLSVVTVGDCG
jgi:hypothetical protein